MNASVIKELTSLELDQIGGGSVKDVEDFFSGVWEGICSEAHNLASGAL